MVSNKVDLSISVAGIKMKNPVLTASGTFGFGREFASYYNLNELGGLTVKGLTLEPREGNKPPRMAETSSGILNSVGLQNPGVDYFLKNEVPYLNKIDTAIIANISGNTIEEYCKMAEKIGDSIDGIEMNISCPNVKEGGVAFGTNPNGVYEITKRVKKYCKVPLIVKLSPNVKDIKEIALSAQEGGADCISLINTLLGMAIDINTRRVKLGNIVGGLSGPAIKPVALRMVWEVCQVVNIPVIGMGGITNWEDAIEFILAGANAVGVGTANFINPLVSIEIIEGIKNYMINNSICSLDEIRGRLLL